jgi:hypothetical protein
MNKRLCRLLSIPVILFSFFLAVPWRAASAQPPEAEKPVDILWGVKIPMRDGVQINATVYKPGAVTTPLPVIFTLTPYISDIHHPRAMYFARNEYVFVLVDCRGRGSSGGAFDPFNNEARDGYDIVEWLARQPWSNGKVAMWGGSYGGFDQWSTVKEFPPHLTTVVPAASVHVGVDFPFYKNIFYSYDIQWLTYTSGVTLNEKLFGESSFWTQKFSEMYDKHLPFKDLDRLVGNTSTVFQKWIQHPTPDPFWEAMVPSPEQYKRINIPILTITGHYDDDQPGAMTYYRSHMRYGNDEARARHYLIVGPWDHSGTRTPRKEVGGLKFGDASMLDLNKLHKEWYDWTMKNGAKPSFLKQRVAYYLMGRDEWKYADSLEAITNTRRRLYLGSDGHANSVFHSGFLSEAKPGVSTADHYVYDPLDTRPGELDREEFSGGLVDQRGVVNLFGNGLVYHSEPFNEDTEVTGALKFVAWMAMDVPDTDFQVFVYEILRDGTSVQLTSDMMRARYRESLKVEKLVKPGEINQYEFDGFTFFSRRISKGSHLRLVIKSPNTIAYEKNYNSGGVVAEESAKDTRIAHITFYHDADHPSFLELPIVK